MTYEEIHERTIFYNLLRAAYAKGALLIDIVMLPEGESLFAVLKINELTDNN